MIEKLKYEVFENLGQERPDTKEMTDKLNEVIDWINKNDSAITFLKQLNQINDELHETR